jgi:hypothetical protein
MKNVFVSSERIDEAHCQALIQALQNAGFVVHIRREILLMEMTQDGKIGTSRTWILNSTKPK